MLVNMKFKLKHVLPEKDLSKKAATIKRFEYPLLGSELKKQTNIEEKHCKRLDNTYELEKIIKKEKIRVKKQNGSNLIYSIKYSYSEYYKLKSLRVILK